MICLQSCTLFLLLYFCVLFIIRTRLNDSLLLYPQEWFNDDAQGVGVVRQGGQDLMQLLINGISETRAGQHAVTRTETATEESQREEPIVLLIQNHE
jgi:hypothetical protein